MALYLTGDTHGNFRRFLPESFYEQETMTKKDIVLVCGDLGGVWYGDKRDDDGLDFLERRPFTTAFVPGNHENYDALRTYPLEEWHGGKVRPIRPSVLMLNGARCLSWAGSASSPWAEPAATISGTAFWSRTTPCSKRSSRD